MEKLHDAHKEKQSSKVRSVLVAYIPRYIRRIPARQQPLHYTHFDTPCISHNIQQKRPNKEPEKGLCWVFSLWVFDMVGNLLVTVAAALLDILDR